MKNSLKMPCIRRTFGKSVILFVCFIFIFTTYVFLDVVFLVSLSRFHNISIKLEDVESLEEIRLLVDELKREMSLLSVSPVVLIKCTMHPTEKRWR